MTENEARKRVQDIGAMDEWFIMLSIAKANMMVGKSVPYIGQLEDGGVLVRNNSMYVLYTDLFKYMGQYGYRKIRGREELLQIAKEHEIERLIVTDGPHGMALLEKTVWAEA